MSSIWDDLEAAKVKGNRDKLPGGRGVVAIRKATVKRSENPKQKGQLIMVVELAVNEFRCSDPENDKCEPGDHKSFTINLSNEYAMGEAKSLIAECLGEPLSALNSARLQKAVEGGELEGKAVRINRIESVAKGTGMKYFQNYFEAYDGFVAPDGWFPHPDRAGTYYNAAGELRTQADF